MLLVPQNYQCHQGKDMHKASKKHYQTDKTIQQVFDHCVLKSRKLAQHTKKVECPFVFGQKNINLSTFEMEKKHQKKKNRSSKKNQIISRGSTSTRQGSKK